MSKTARVFIQMGPGGVGKTTLSAAFGVYWAQKGYRVLVMTIDPSKRLAQALGVDRKAPLSKVELTKTPGQLYVKLLNHGEIFDEFIIRISRKNPLAEKLLKNRLYVALKTQLQGSQDFTALLDLYENATRGEYDIVILDTPPAQHAWQFLESPEKLSQLFNEKVTKWFQWIGGPKSQEKSVWNQILNAGTQKVLKSLEFLTGSEFMGQISDFFSVTRYFQGDLLDKIHKSQALLKSPSTEYTLISVQDEIKIKESLIFAQEILKKGLNLKRLILNRAWPDSTQLDLSRYSSAKQKEIERVLSLIAASQSTHHELLSSWPQGLEILKVYDTLKSSHDLEMLVEMAHDMANSMK